MKKNTKNIILYISVFVFILVLYILGFGIKCPFHYFTGLYCPGCGSTRMFASIFKLDFYQAFRFNPLLFILIVSYFIYFIIKIMLKRLYNISIKIPQFGINILLIVTLLYWILRNIPYFSWLAPTIVN